MKPFSDSKSDTKVTELLLTLFAPIHFHSIFPTYKSEIKPLHLSTISILIFLVLQTCSIIVTVDFSARS